MRVPAFSIKRPHAPLVALVALLVCAGSSPARAAAKASKAPKVSTANCYGHYSNGIFQYGTTTTNYVVDVHSALGYGQSVHPELADQVGGYIIAAMNAVNPSIQYAQANGTQPYIIMNITVERNASQDRYGLLVVVYGPDSIDATGAKFNPPFSTTNMRQWFAFQQDLLYLADTKMMTDAGTKVGQYLSTGWTCSNPDRP
ncbi:exported hypothetical protein [Candidatus Sulfotelmatomonas gaucii]|uniref:Lipoprotein n=1 Tax=Candidatus Sulfuritelmatomonas gaucii TaxID=2043161 RepID=A0A2N9L2R1_9BACT|nr:exported hypothetical protein [Candidatus Sulfotelmatomonas gaucii]